ncbi:uncharacterized protein LOC107040893 [Diachasma alloeum]|uniref:uncharacterized protein LOC107040893 n=1 Tax=Diachasma alloeum TaxID=454923 RepID=UPI00073838F3|nr:uncharacterized protein LOC107040893 [Diachasma alloeum]
MVGSPAKKSDRGFLSRGRIFPASAMDLIVCLSLVLVIANVVLAENTFYTQGRYGKREESHPSAGALPYFSLSRHVRSDKKSNHASNTQDSNTVKVSSRPDRFFLGSRYGKRALPRAVELSDGSPLASLDRLETILRYLNRARRSDQRSSAPNYEIEQIYYDNGYDNGNDDNGVGDNDSKTLCQSDSSQC